MNKIVYERKTQGTEPSKYLEEEKSKRDSLSSGERRGKSLNLVCVSLAALHGGGCKRILERAQDRSSAKFY